MSTIRTDHSSTSASAPLAIPRPRSSAAERRPIAIKREPTDAPAQPRMALTTMVEDKNRDVLTKVVLDEMKRCGLKDYRRKERAKSIMPPGQDLLEVAMAGDDERQQRWAACERAREEYKAVFHHTIRAAVFALRHQGFAERAVTAERMAASVRLLLAAFLPADAPQLLEGG